MRPSWRWYHYKAGVVPIGGRLVRLSPFKAEFLMLLVMRPAWTTNEIIEAVWGDDPDGGPMDAGNTLSAHILRLNQMIAPWRVISVRRGLIALDDGSAVCDNQRVADAEEAEGDEQGTVLLGADRRRELRAGSGDREEGREARIYDRVC